ncbi:MFS general substrate transporter [Cryphonectria parasitica EP155]|uniref:MFS general substrate transporter n=1 Tax=Cryphonectria parasitica (strain ATCC 38755 / EP155) TaxID=660469 RepID=A0A9P4XVH7_CRYP1|nr:MFS general substrate transporter [Cryphonectria parasitica EP155]KAF3761530.1 MFS general substrate transporter [Cryphonectria parasitica EP155]
MRSLSQMRSQNGYGCDDVNDAEDEEDDEEGASSSSDPEAQREKRNKKERDEFEVTFEGGTADPWNPRNRGTPRKWMIVTLASAGSFCVTCASSIYTPTYTQMDAEFGCSHIVATLGLSTFVLGIALGPMWSPLSEFYGRRPIYLAAFAVFTIWIIPCAVSRNIQTVIIARFFQGLSGSAFLSVSGGTVSDLFAPDKMHHPLTLFTAAPFLGPCVGPLMGGFINSNVNWRWTHYVMIIWASCMFLAIFFFVPETYHPVILRKKAMHIRKETGDDRWKAPIEKSNKSMIRTVGYSLLRPFQILIFEPMALILDLYSAILLGILYLFFGAFPFVFEGAFGFNLWQTGLTFLGMLFGMLIASLTSGLWMDVRRRLVERNGGKIEPEFRLPAVIVGSVFVTVGLFWFAWTTFSWLHWILPIIGSGIFGLGVILSFSGTFTYLVETYPVYAASSLAANAFTRCLFAAAFPLFGTQMYEKLGDQWATSLLAFLTAAMLPFPVLFFKFGKRIRAHSRMATAA